MIKVQDIFSGIWGALKHFLVVLLGMFLLCWFLFPPTALLTILVMEILERAEVRRIKEGRA